MVCRCVWYRKTSLVNEEAKAHWGGYRAKRKKNIVINVYLLGTFAKLRNATISFVMSVCLSSDFTKLEFDSYILQQEDQQVDTFRLLGTENRVVLPINSPIRIIVTAADELHSWTVPRLGVKIDATPGRLNQVRFPINRPGLLYGQCSEICRTNHRFIPIVLERVSTNQFIYWVSKIRESSDDWKQVMVS
jgi:heme/copper-type cytochrome/quinol oxidase subunit 2